MLLYLETFIDEGEFVMANLIMYVLGLALVTFWLCIFQGIIATKEHMNTVIMCTFMYFLVFAILSIKEKK